MGFQGRSPDLPSFTRLPRQCLRTPIALALCAAHPQLHRSRGCLPSGKNRPTLCTWCDASQPTIRYQRNHDGRHDAANEGKGATYADPIFAGTCVRALPGACRRAGARCRPARRHRYRNRHRHHHRSVRRDRRAGRQQQQRHPHGVRRGQRKGRHQRPQDQIHRRGQPVHRAARRAGDEQAAEQRRHLHGARRRRHADERRQHAGAVRQERAEHVSADRRAVDVRALQQAEIRAVRLVLRPDARRR